MNYSRFTRQTEITNYMPIPRHILSLSLPFSAVVLYGLLMDRGTLSRKNGFADESSWIYVVYPVLELAEVLGISPTSVKKDLKKLEEKGLIRRVRRSRKEANRIYLLLPGDAVTATGRETGKETGKDRKCTSEGQKQSCRRETIVAPSNMNKQRNIIDLYQHKQEESL